MGCREIRITNLSLSGNHRKKKARSFPGKDRAWDFFGSSSKTRTCDKVVNSHLLYQLSYRGLKQQILRILSHISSDSGQPVGARIYTTKTGLSIFFYWWKTFYNSSHCFIDFRGGFFRIRLISEPVTTKTKVLQKQGFLHKSHRCCF